jgi:hypothetical protein
MKQQINSAMNEEAKTQVERYGETKIELGKVSCVYNMKEFCDCLISTINIATTYHNDIDQWSDE